MRLFSGSGTLDVTVLKSQLDNNKIDFDIVNFWLEKSSWYIDAANLFNALENPLLAKILSLKFEKRNKLDLKTKLEYPFALALYPLIDKIKTFTFEEQSTLFHTKHFCTFWGNGGVWGTGRINELLDPTDPFNQSEIGILYMLHILQCKEKSFERRNEAQAKEATHKLHQNLSQAFDSYWSNVQQEINKEKLDNDAVKALFDTFGKQWDAAIIEAKPTLEKYRGMGNLLVNLLMNVVTLGLCVIWVTYHSNGKKMLHPFLTSDSSNILNGLTACYKNIKIGILNHRKEPDTTKNIVFCPLVS